MKILEETYKEYLKFRVIEHNRCELQRRQTELQLIGVITLMICRLDGLRKYKKQIIREQRSLSRKYENLKKGGATQRVNIQKQRLKVQKLHHKINNIRTDYSNKTITEIVKTKHLTLSRCEYI